VVGTLCDVSLRRRVETVTLAITAIHRRPHRRRLRSCAASAASATHRTAGQSNGRCGGTGRHGGIRNCSHSQRGGVLCLRRWRISEGDAISRSNGDGEFFCCMMSPKKV
jgi:hypothetical protein